MFHLGSMMAVKSPTIKKLRETKYIHLAQHLTTNPSVWDFLSENNNNNNNN
jgi:hypothetical protein